MNADEMILELAGMIKAPVELVVVVVPECTDDGGTVLVDTVGMVVDGEAMDLGLSEIETLLGLQIQPTARPAVLDRFTSLTYQLMRGRAFTQRRTLKIAPRTAV